MMVERNVAKHGFLRFIYHLLVYVVLCRNLIFKFNFLDGIEMLIFKMVFCGMKRVLNCVLNIRFILK